MLNIPVNPTPTINCKYRGCVVYEDELRVIFRDSEIGITKYVIYPTAEEGPGKIEEVYEFDAEPNKSYNFLGLQKRLSNE